MIYMSFKIIETQEELDQIIEGRLSRQREQYEKRLAQRQPENEELEKLRKTNTDLEKQVSTLQSSIEESNTAVKTHEQTVADLNKKIAGYETANLRTKIALQNGLPIDLADRLVGDDEASIKADAERLAGYVNKKQQTPPPLKSTENKNGNDNDTSWLQAVRDLSGKGE